MYAIAARCGAAARFGAVLLLMLGASGCGNKEEQGEGKKAKGPLDCGSKPVTVDVAPNFATPEAVYVCEGDTVTWTATAAVQTFEVEFKKDYPFDGPPKKFHKGDPPSPKTKKQKQGLTVYEYKITVNGQPSPDPQVVGGGGN